MTKTEMAKQIWLLYFNRVLKDRGVITGEEYRKMQLLITGSPRGSLR